MSDSTKGMSDIVDVNFEAFSRESSSNSRPFLRPSKDTLIKSWSLSISHSPSNLTEFTTGGAMEDSSTVTNFSIDTFLPIAPETVTLNGVEYVKKTDD